MPFPEWDSHNTKAPGDSEDAALNFRSIAPGTNGRRTWYAVEQCRWELARDGVVRVPAVAGVHAVLLSVGPGGERARLFEPANEKRVVQARITGAMFVERRNNLKRN